MDTPYSQRFFILSAFCFSQFGRSTAQPRNSIASLSQMQSKDPIHQWNFIDRTRLTQQPNKLINIPTLSLCITFLMVDITQEYYATMMAAVKVQNDRGKCTMPTLSRLLQNQRIAETDSFVICVQIHNPTGPQYPQHPLAYYVPKDLLNGVEASLDNPYMGDFVFFIINAICSKVSQAT
ncbi:hypothetical protein BU17DRAFT_64121 [Hysterangium stoloniferum]|nr:hypothetical protein BU17DRAFT_64121 [Hysterangium stoloniferum]